MDSLTVDGDFGARASRHSRGVEASDGGEAARRSQVLVHAANTTNKHTRSEPGHSKRKHCCQIDAFEGVSTIGSLRRRSQSTGSEQTSGNTRHNRRTHFRLPTCRRCRYRLQRSSNCILIRATSQSRMGNTLKHCGGRKTSCTLALGSPGAELASIAGNAYKARTR